MDWSPDGFVFKVDDEPFYEVPKTTVEQYGRWAYDDPKHLIVNLALGGQYPQGVNHAATPYPACPRRPSNLIKADRAIMLVDWIRVTGR